MDYLGNKAGFAADLVEIVGHVVPPGARVADVFAGTGSVAMAFARAGYDVTATDHLPLSATWTTARLLSAGARFDALEAELGPLGDDPLATVVAGLGTLPAEDGWVTRSYSPASLPTSGVERRYLTEVNARRIDAIRHRLRAWRPLLSSAENALLMTCLLEAVSEVSNVAGTYGCYLKQWKPAALAELSVRPYRDVAGRGRHEVGCRDAAVVAAETSAAAVYADPPYTKRQYAAYYHLLNSIATDHEGDLSGSTGLPDWRPLASDWCYRQRASQALERLVAKCAAPVLALSYSSDGHLTDEEIRGVLTTHGRLEVHHFERRRYRSSALPHRGPTVLERLYLMQR